MKTKILFGLTLLVLLGLVTSACAGPATTQAPAAPTLVPAVSKPAAATPQYTFYYVTHCLPSDPFWATQFKGMTDAAERYNIKAVYLGSKVSGDVGELLGNLETAIAAKPDGIAVVVTDAKPLDEPLRRAINQGIPVVAANVRDFRDPPDRIPYLIYIGEDSYLSGAKQAEKLVDVFKKLYGRVPKRSVFAIHEPGNVVQEMRANGVIDVLKKAGVATVDKVDVTYEPAKVSETLRAYLQAHPDTESIHTGNILVAHWAVQLLEEMGRLGNVNSPAKEGNTFVAGIDMSPEGIQDVIDGKIVDTIDQQPYLQGYYAMELLWFWKTYKMVPATNISTGPYVIDKDNAAAVLELVKAGYR
jgi:simple sugar transport system substrate-binding protein